MMVEVKGKSGRQKALLRRHPADSLEFVINLRALSADPGRTVEGVVLNASAMRLL